MIDAKADVEEQWKQWQDENPPSSFVDIDTAWSSCHLNCK